MLQLVCPLAAKKVENTSTSRMQRGAGTRVPGGRAQHPAGEYRVADLESGGQASHISTLINQDI